MNKRRRALKAERYMDRLQEHQTRVVTPSPRWYGQDVKIPPSVWAVMYRMSTAAWRRQELFNRNHPTVFIGGFVPIDEQIERTIAASENTPVRVVRFVDGDR